MSFDSEEARLVDRIQATAFYQAKISGADFITRKWVADKLKRSESWVTKNWTKSAMECFTDFSKCGRPGSLSQESKDLITSNVGMQRKSCRLLAGEILAKRRKIHSREAVRQFLRNEGFKPFHVITKPLKTDLNKENRLFLAEYCQNLEEEDFLHYAFSDEFFIYSIRKPNHQNDRVWALEQEDIPEYEHYRQIVKNPTCIGLFLMFTAKRMMWVIKAKGQSWDGDYFRRTVLARHVIPFLSDPDNVLVVGETTFVHDRAPCMKANKTQEYLKRKEIQFWGNDLWPGNSPDLNPTENLGEVVKNRVEEKMHKEIGPGRYSEETLLKNLNMVLGGFEHDTDLFENLLCSMPERLRQVKEAEGGHTLF